MKRKIGLVFAVLGFFVVTGCGISKMKESGSGLMEAMKAGDADKSFTLLDEALQKEVGGIEGWKKWTATRKPVSWFFNSYSEQVTDKTGTIKGTVDFPEKQTAETTIRLKKYGEAWKVIGIDFKVEK